MIELTPAQWDAVTHGAEHPPRLVDPVTHTKYVLLREDIYDRVKQMVVPQDDSFVQELLPQVMEVFGRDGWDDPSMDIYNDLDPRNHS